MNELEARQILSHLVEPGDPTAGAALRRFGAAELASALLAGAGGDVGCGNIDQTRSAVQVLRAVADEAAAAARLGVIFVIPGSRQWPTQLDDLGDRRPLILRGLGSIPLRRALLESVAIVGARACTRYGASVAETIAADLAAQRVCVVSGGAFGIDAAAHRGALAGGGSSVAVSAAGVDIPCPRGNQRLFEALSLRGAIVSEVPLGREPRRHHFLVRNRLIAALVRVVVVVEAGSRSGARRTANEAIRHGRVLAAVPGSVTSAASVGCHELLRAQMAVLVRGAEDVRELLAPIGTGASLSELTGER